MTTTQHTTHHTTLALPVPTQELMSSVLGSGWDEAGYDWWRSAPMYASGCDWDITPYDPDAIYVKLAIADPNTYDTDEDAKVIMKALTANDIIKGVEAILKQCPWVRWDDMDASDGDMVLQYAILGEVTYG
jgi:hypothetical protein